MIIQSLSYEALFVKIDKAVVLEYVVGVTFNDDRTIDVLFSEQVNWKVIKDAIGGVNIYVSEPKETLDLKWKHIMYIEPADYLVLTL